MSEETNVVTKKLNKKLLIMAVVLITIVLAVVLATVASKSASAKKLEEQLSLGDKYLSELDYEQAIASYLAAIEIDPKNVDAYLGLADAYIAQGAYDEAIEVLEDALEELRGNSRKEIKDKLKEVREKMEAEEIVPPSESTATTTTIPSLGQPSINQIATAEIGDVVKFGRFLQDTVLLEFDSENFTYDEENRNKFDSSAEEIEWYVLDRKEDKVLLFSKYVLDTKPFHKEYNEVTWAQSSIREWLNNMFYNFAFNEAEKNYICKTKLSNNDNVEHASEGGEATIDNVFLLSIDEAKKYFNYTYDSSSMSEFEEYEKTRLDKRLIGVVTNYAMYNDSMNYGIEDSEDCSTWWYLRSVGRSNLYSAIVEPWGYINVSGFIDFLVDTPNGIRPAIWVDIEENSNENDILDLTDGEEKSADRIFHSLKADPEALLSFDELNFLGHSIVDLDIDTVRSLLEENNYNVRSNLDREDSNDDYVWLGGYPYDENVGIANISAMQYFGENYVCLWHYNQFTHNNEIKSPVGVRNIQMHDTFGEVLEKIGFNNAYEVEADMEFFFSGYCDLENGLMEEKHWNTFWTMTNYNRDWTDGLVIFNNSVGYSSEGYYFDLILSDTLFQEKNGNKNYNLSLQFEQDENTNGKFILTDYSMSVE